VSKSALTFVLGLLLAACATYREDLNRSQRFYEENEYERALAVLRALEHDRDSLSLNDQARYAYLRGMTDYRLGFRADARHWLALAKATEQEHPGGLSQPWKQRLEDALNDLNRDVFGGAPRGEPASGVVAPNGAATDAAAPQPCTADSDCSLPNVCESGQCVPPR
jgi:hypothetical protein